MNLLQIYQWVCQWKNFENPLTFWEVKGKSLVSCFFETQCMYYLFDATNAHQTTNTKSKVKMTYSTKQQNQKKLFHLTKLYKERIRKDFLWRSVEYSGSWYECGPVNFKPGVKQCETTRAVKRWILQRVVLSHYVDFSFRFSLIHQYALKLL